MKCRCILEIKKEGFDHKTLDANGKTQLVRLIEGIETQTGLKLMARNEEDTVDGFITVYGDDVKVFVYDEDEAPSKEHKSTLRKVVDVPQANVDKIDTLVRGG